MAWSKARQLELPLPLRQGAHLSHACIAFGAKLVPYAVRRSRRRRGSYSLAIDERGLRIGVAWDASERWIERILRDHARWIVRKLDEWQARRAPAVTWCDGAILMLLGAPVRLTFASGIKAVAREEDRVLIDAHGRAPVEIVGAVTDWLRTEAIECFGKRIAYYAPLLRVAPRAVRLSQARTRWGSCHPDGRIFLNWRLVQMPLALIDYVVAHELAHLREMNHSPRFWRAVAEVIPDYVARRKSIREQGHRYLVV